METLTEPVMLLTHGCEVDKRTGEVLQVCRVRRLDSLIAGQGNVVRAGGMKNAMYLGQVSTLGELFADFRFWHRVRREDLSTARDAHQCIASMTVDGRLSLQEHLFRFHTRRLRDQAPPDTPDAV